MKSFTAYLILIGWQFEATFGCNTIKFPENSFLGFSYVPPANRISDRQCVQCRESPRDLWSDVYNAAPRNGFGMFGTTAPPCCTTPTEATTVNPGTTGTTSVAPSCRCGVKGITKIVNGVETQVNEYPWMVGIIVTPFNPTRFSCGGTLLNSQYVLTAAHCVVLDSSTQANPASDFKVVLGEHDQSSTTETNLRKVVNVAQVFVAPGYVNTRNENDLAVFKLAESVDLNTYTPACLPASGAEFTNQAATITGWGATQEGGSTSNVLREAQVTIVSDGTCRNAYASISSVQITDNMVCAAGSNSNGNTDTCQGDSGGPMSVADSNGYHSVVGVTSFGIGCARDGLFGVYAQVSKFLDFINTSVANGGGATTCRSS